MKFNNTKILVIGGSGFIGSALIESLERFGASVDSYSRSNNLDIRNVVQLRKFIKKKYDVIYHLAGLSGSPKGAKYESEFFETNTMATINLFKLIIKYSPKSKIILSGTRLEYGVPRYLPVDELHPTLPISIYGLSKLAASQAALGFYNNNNLQVTVVRTSNVYGPWNRKEFSGYNVLSYFISQSLKNKSLEIFGKGDQLRDYIYIQDLINAFIKLAQQKSSGEVFNLGFGTGIKFADMISLIVKKVGRGEIVYKDWPKKFKEVETGSFITDISKLKKSIGFVPKTDFEKGIEQTIQNLL